MFVIFQDYVIIVEPINDQMYIINRDCTYISHRERKTELFLLIYIAYNFQFTTYTSDLKKFSLNHYRIIDRLSLKNCA